MPKTTINKNANPFTLKGDVRCTWQRCMASPAVKPADPEDMYEPLLG
jgi:hypothetical protein